MDDLAFEWKHQRPVNTAFFYFAIMGLYLTYRKAAINQIQPLTVSVSSGVWSSTDCACVCVCFDWFVSFSVALYPMGVSAGILLSLSQHQLTASLGFNAAVRGHKAQIKIHCFATVAFTCRTQTQCALFLSKLTGNNTVLSKSRTFDSRWRQTEEKSCAAERMRETVADPTVVLHSCVSISVVGSVCFALLLRGLLVSCGDTAILYAPLSSVLCLW